MQTTSLKTTQRSYTLLERTHTQDEIDRYKQNIAKYGRNGNFGIHGKQHTKAHRHGPLWTQVRRVRRATDTRDTKVTTTNPQTGLRRARGLRTRRRALSSWAAGVGDEGAKPYRLQEKRERT